MTLSIRPATLNDVAQMDRMEQEAFSTPWSLSLLRAAVLNLSYEVRVVRDETDGVVAFYIAHATNSLSNLDNLVVDSPQRGTGLGDMLLSDWMERARKRTLDRLTLQVRTDNQVAQRLYNKHHFSCTRLLECYYPDGSSAYQMERRFTLPRAREAARPRTTMGDVAPAGSTW